MDEHGLVDGTITGAAGTTAYKIVATDRYDREAVTTQTFSITVVDDAPSFPVASVEKSFAVGRAIVRAVDGEANGPLPWARPADEEIKYTASAGADGELKANGMKLVLNHKAADPLRRVSIEGTPREITTTPIEFTVTATNLLGQTDTLEVVVNVVEAPEALSFTRVGSEDTNCELTLGVRAECDAFTANGDDCSTALPEYVEYELSRIPAGMTFDKSTAVLSGTPERPAVSRTHHLTVEKGLIASDGSRVRTEYASTTVRIRIDEAADQDGLPEFDSTPTESVIISADGGTVALPTATVVGEDTRPDEDANRENTGETAANEITYHFEEALPASIAYDEANHELDVAANLGVQVIELTLVATDWDSDGFDDEVSTTITIIIVESRG